MIKLLVLFSLAVATQARKPMITFPADTPTIPPLPLSPNTPSTVVGTPLPSFVPIDPVQQIINELNSIALTMNHKASEYIDDKQEEIGRLRDSDMEILLAHLIQGVETAEKKENVTEELTAKISKLNQALTKKGVTQAEASRIVEEINANLAILNAALSMEKPTEAPTTAPESVDRLPWKFLKGKGFGF